MSDRSSSSPVIRTMVPSDLDRIVEIDIKVLGKPRPEYWEMTNNLKKVGVDTIYTFVTRRDWKLLKFFNSMDFQKGDMINLEYNI